MSSVNIDRIDYTTVCCGRPPCKAHEVVQFRGLLYKVHRAVDTYPWLLDIGVLYFQYNAVVTLAGNKADMITPDPTLSELYTRVAGTDVKNLVAVVLGLDALMIPSRSNYQWPVSVSHTVTEVFAHIETLLLKMQSDVLQRTFIWGDASPTACSSHSVRMPRECQSQLSESTLPASLDGSLQSPVWNEPYRPVVSPSTPSPLSLEDY
jgi:hypothetical protein